MTSDERAKMLRVRIRYEALRAARAGIGRRPLTAEEISKHADAADTAICLSSLVHAFSIYSRRTRG
jgi:hypothetical protein